MTKDELLSEYSQLLCRVISGPHTDRNGDYVVAPCPLGRVMKIAAEDETLPEEAGRD